MSEQNKKLASTDKSASNKLKLIMLGVKFEWNANAIADIRKLILTPFKNT